MYDVIILGGSYSGLSAAMALGRSLRKVLIIDSGMPCNRQTPHSHNFITQDGKTPNEISTLARQQVEKYNTVKFINGKAVKGNKTPTGFSIKTLSSEIFHARKLIFATGITDIMPDIRGFSECWGISVVHCPYCHGYELREKVTAIIANGDKAFHIASLVSNLTRYLTILTSGEPNFTNEQADKLSRHHIKIVSTGIAEIIHQEGQMNSIVFQDGTTTKFDAAYAALPFVQQTDIAGQLGCEMTEHGYIKVDPFQHTNVKGIFACGDNSSLMRSVANAVSTGNLAGALANKELCEEDF